MRRRAVIGQAIVEILVSHPPGSMDGFAYQRLMALAEELGGDPALVPTAALYTGQCRCGARGYDPEGSGGGPCRAWPRCTPLAADEARP